MQKNSYVILGVSENASEIQVAEAYSKLRAKYSEQRYRPGDEGSEAARKLTELDAAYEDVKIDLQNRNAKNEGGLYEEIEQLIKKGNLEQAQSKLDIMSERSAEWHYLQSILFYKKNWYNDSKKQLEFACKADPNNTKYSDALLRLNNLMNTGGPNPNASSGYNTTQSTTQGGNQYNRGATPPPQDRQMGGCGTEMNCCANLICADCCCEMMGGDLIACC